MFRGRGSLSLAVVFFLPLLARGAEAEQVMSLKTVERPHFIAFLEDQHERVYLAAREGPWGLAVLEEGRLRPLLYEQVFGVAVARDGRLYWTTSSGVFTAPLFSSHKQDSPVTVGERSDVTASFGGPPRGERRVVLAADGAVWVEGCAKRRLAEGSFQAVPAAPPAVCAPVPLAWDIHGNYWALAEVAGDQDRRQLLVLPKQAPAAWQVVNDGDLRPGPWRTVACDEFGGVWLAGKDRAQRLNPLRPEEGWLCFTAADGLPSAEITAMVAAEGEAVWLGLAAGGLAHCALRDGQHKKVELRVCQEAAAVVAMFRDSRGRLWLAEGNRVRCHPPPVGAWQRRWKLAGRMPHSNHDLCGAVLGEQFYVAGGATQMFGYPARPHVVDEIWVYRPDWELWSVAAKLRGPRVFNALAAFGRRLWVIGGEVIEDKAGAGVGRRAPSATVEIYDPQTGTVSAGPELAFARPMPLAAVLGERLYVVGDSPTHKEVGVPMESIALGESLWRREADAPLPLEVLAGCVLEGRWYVWTAKKGLLVFDPAKGAWESFAVPPPHAARAPALAAHQGTLWVLGGRDVADPLGVFRFERRAKSWLSGPPLPCPLSWAACGELRGQLVIAGGAGEIPYAKRTFTFSNALYRLRQP